jgi:hypothetical protein
MSRGPWKPSTAREAKRLIQAAQTQGYVITSIETSDGPSVRRPGERDEATAETSETLRDLERFTD